MFKNHQITKKMFFDTLIVMIVAELTGAATCLIDGLITGRYLGYNEMAAFGYSCTYFSIVSIVNGIIMVGNQILCVNTISKGDKESTNKIISISLLLGVIFTLLISCFMFICPALTAALFGADTSSNAIMSNFIPYIKGVCFGAPFWCMFVVFTPIIQLDGGSRRAKIAALISGITDVGLDILLGIVLKMGMLGMGLATCFSHIVGCVITMSHFFSKKSTYHFTFKQIGFKYILPILKNGLPRAVSMIARTIGPIILNIIILNVDKNGTIGLTALSVQRTISFLAASIGWGICGTTLMLGSLFYNEKNIDELKTMLKLSLLSIVVFVGCLTGLLYVFASQITYAFQSSMQTNPYLYLLTFTSLKYYFLSLPFLAFNVSFANFIQSVGRNLLANIMNALTECISLVIACYTLALTNKYVGFFSGFFYGELFLSVLIIIITIVHRLVNHKNEFSLYFIKPNYVNVNDKILHATLTNYEEIEELSIKAHDLCKGTHLTSSQAYKVGLCVEEMATNVFIHGFTKDHKKHIVEMRIVISDENAVITLVDDCRKFDISQKLKSWALDPDHPEKNLGIRTIMLTATKVTYSNTMNMNNLQITI